MYKGCVRPAEVLLSASQYITSYVLLSPLPEANFQGEKKSGSLSLSLRNKSLTGTERERESTLTFTWLDLLLVHIWRGQGLLLEIGSGLSVPLLSLSPLSLYATIIHALSSLSLYTTHGTFSYFPLLRCNKRAIACSKGRDVRVRVCIAITKKT